VLTHACPFCEVATACCASSPCRPPAVTVWLDRPKATMCNAFCDDPRPESQEAAVRANDPTLSRPHVRSVLSVSWPVGEAKMMHPWPCSPRPPSIPWPAEALHPVAVFDLLRLPSRYTPSSAAAWILFSGAAQQRHPPFRLDAPSPCCSQAAAAKWVLQDCAPYIRQHGDRTDLVRPGK